MADEKLPRASILRKRADFLQARNKGRRIAGSFLVLNWFEEKTSHRQVGVVVSKVVGGAVARNRLKRRVREIYRRLQGKLREGVKSVWVIRKKAVEATYDDLKKEMEKIYRKEKLLSKEK